MAFNGKWTVSKFEGLNDVMDAYGVAADKRDPSKLQGGSVEIKQDGDNFTFTATGGLGKSGTHTMTVGGPSEGELFGKAYSGTTAWEGDVLVFKGKSGVVLKRSIEGANLVYTIEFGGKTGKVFLSK
ncbi:putative fatty acid-binding protein type 3-like [Apostichopus japonicus]|uniref:Putative fatty acid-binding protein type 3-like n=1 Tax=Stichopus japonicus TaxID=307972 RepID=A0A2G8K9G8_STIJA|nr:putative fatty acid-binding protein type 3-like [Apostichopus japonicus]